MQVIDTEIPDVKILQPKVFGDDRGFFIETWNAKTFAELGLNVSFVQDNHSRSSRGVLRGLHYQLQQPQGKLVRVTVGRVFDVAVDMRKSSSTFGKSVGFELSAANKNMLWVPPGFAHGFLCLEDGTDFMYKCTDFYAPQDEISLLWDDPMLEIKWPLEGITPIVSAKDKIGVLLSKAETYA
jgi:dTDP-4-dehydrorhamnose 3,5-epimerase